MTGGQLITAVVLLLLVDNAVLIYIAIRTERRARQGLQPPTVSEAALQQAKHRKPPLVLARHAAIVAGALGAASLLLALLSGSFRGEESAFLARLDAQIADALHNAAYPTLVTLMEAISFSAAWQVTVSVGALIIIVYTYRGRWRRSFEYIAVTGAGAYLNHLLKLFFDRTRPVFENPFVTLDSKSFPSGHSTSAFLLFGFLGYLAWQSCRSRIARIAIVSACATMILLVGLSRMVLGAHYLTDVLAGFTTGAAWLTLCVTIIEGIRRGVASNNTDEVANEAAIAPNAPHNQNPGIASADTTERTTE